MTAPAMTPVLSGSLGDRPAVDRVTERFARSEQNREHHNGPFPDCVAPRGLVKETCCC